ncbi:hypothetical protein VP01_145g1 [Puccinia sorghi]|uniref:HAT C-terminal dimerisation domain-containing protein n=1 Tax=Puccinia sorghi TaxID=27349 RepID=A0A0L6VJV0_9BASI|nr:hypothetical protein VP01_145g1 [Puccinia sorghi]
MIQKSGITDLEFFSQLYRIVKGKLVNFLIHFASMLSNILYLKKMYITGTLFVLIDLGSELCKIPQSIISLTINPAGYGITTPVKRPGMIQPPSNSQLSIGQPNVPSDSENKTQITSILSKKNSLPPNQPRTLAHPRLLILLKTWMRKKPKSNANLKEGIQCLMMSRNSFLNQISCKGDVQIFIIHIIHQVPTSVCGARRKSMYLEAVVESLDSLGWLLRSQTSCQFSKVKPRQIQKKSQSLTKQKGLIKKIPIASHLCGFYIKQSHGPVLKTHIFKQIFTNVNLDQSCSNRNGLQPLVCKSLHFQNKIIVIYWYCNLFQQATNIKFSLIHEICITKGTTLVSLVHKSHLLIMIGIMLLNIFLSILIERYLQKNIIVINTCFARQLIQVPTTTQWPEHCIRNFTNMKDQSFIGTVIPCILRLGIEAPPPPKLKNAFLGCMLWMNRDHIVSSLLARKRKKHQRARGLFHEYMSCLAIPASKDQKSLLIWSKVFSISASSCAAERTFSSAANVFSSGCGSLKPQTMKRCVTSHMWLKQGIKLTGKFEKAKKIQELR